MAIRQTVAPATEPVTLAEAKLHLRVDLSADDNYITALIEGACQWVSNLCRRQLVTATWQLTLDKFPGEIVVPYPPLQSLTIAYVATSGVEQTLSASLYLVDSEGEPGRVRPAYGQSWPATRGQMNAVEVTFVAGYGSASDVPQGLKQAILYIVGHWYRFREAVVDGKAPARVPLAVESLCWQYRSLAAV